MQALVACAYHCVASLTLLTGNTYLVHYVKHVEVACTGTNNNNNNNNGGTTTNNNNNNNGGATNNNNNNNGR